MRHSCIVALIVVAIANVVVAANNPVPALKDSDRLLVREAQLSLAQAHIARLQAEASVKESEERISRLVQSLKKQYACLNCILNTDFTWTPAPEASPPTTPAKIVTPDSRKQGGADSKKE